MAVTLFLLWIHFGFQRLSTIPVHFIFGQVKGFIGALLDDCISKRRFDQSDLYTQGSVSVVIFVIFPVGHQGSLVL